MYVRSMETEEKKIGKTEKIGKTTVTNHNNINNSHSHSHSHSRTTKGSFMHALPACGAASEREENF